ncbi:MAG: hypothetical protein HQ518_33160, partial [Rhodopirellula sp.]|nr:hypothetical protein [Rhodopirellula sp.]
MDQASPSDNSPPETDGITSGDTTSQRRSRARVTLSAWLCSGAVIAYLCRNTLAVAEKTLRLDLDISEAPMG